MSRIELNWYKMSEWIALHEHYHSGTKCSRAENDRRFNAFAGCAPEVAEYIWKSVV